MIRNVALILSISILITCCDSPKKRVKPNFIVIYTDDQRFNALGVNDNPVISTPNLDVYAKNAIQFNNAHVAFSLCSPSRAAMLTGRYGSQNGVLYLGSALNDGEVTLAQLLKDNGYTTALSGKWHIQPLPQEVGFDQYAYFTSNGAYYNRQVFTNTDTLQPQIHVDEYGVNKSIEYLEQFAEEDTPFFLYHCPQTPHMNGELIWDAKDSTKFTYNVRDMPVTQNRLDDFSNKPAYLKSVRNFTQAKKYGYPDSLAIQQHTLEYYSVISELDGFLGRLFTKMEKLGLDDNTYIIFMSDNGWQLGDHGFTSKVLPYQASTHVPLWMKGPGISPKTNGSLVSNIDILSTVLDLADVEIPANTHGTSLVPVLVGDQSQVRDYFVYEGLGNYGGAKPNLTLINDSYRYIVSYEDESLSTINFRELYSIKNDPLEMDNLIDNESLEGLVSEFHEQINIFKKEISDR